MKTLKIFVLFSLLIPILPLFCRMSLIRSLQQNVPYISQVVQRDCGVAALAMILKNYGSSYSLAYLRELAQTSREGTSALGLVEAGKQLGFETQAIRADLDLFK